MKSYTLLLTLEGKNKIKIVLQNKAHESSGSRISEYFEICNKGKGRRNKALNMKKLNLNNKLSKEIKNIQNGKYINEVREIYEDSMCLGVGGRNVEKVVREVLEKIGGLSVDRLPKATFAKYMYLEARGLAQIQLADELSKGC